MDQNNNLLGVGDLDKYSKIPNLFIKYEVDALNLEVSPTKTGQKGSK